MKNSKSQIINPKQIPPSKFQFSKKVFLTWCLVGVIYLLFASWNLGFTPLEVRCVNASAVASGDLLLTGFTEEKENAAPKREITSDSLRWEHEAGIAIFTGNVVMKGEEGKITSLKMTVFFNEKDEIERIVGEGSATLTRGKHKSGGEVIEIYPAKNLLILKNNAWISSDRMLFRGEEITLDTERDIVHITKGVKGEIEARTAEEKALDKP